MSTTKSDGLQQFNVRIPPSVIERFKADARTRGLSDAKAVVLAFEHWLEYAPIPERPFYDFDRIFADADGTIDGGQV